MSLLTVPPYLTKVWFNMPVSTRSQSGSTAARSAGEIKRPVLAAPHAEKQQNGGPTGKPSPSPVTSAVAYAAPPVNHFFPTTGAIRCVGDELCATIGAIERKRKALGEAGDTECTTADPTGNDVKLLTGEKPMQWHDNKYQGPGQELHSLGLEAWTAAAKASTLLLTTNTLLHSPPKGSVQ